MAEEEFDLRRELVSLFEGSSPKTPLSPEAAAAGLTACYLNAVSLLSEVRILARSGRLARGTALTILALEELAKVSDLNDTTLKSMLSPVPHDWAPFWRRFRSHADKQREITSYGQRSLKEALGEPTMLSNPGPYSNWLPAGLGGLLDIAKQRTFYVDYWNGHFLLPGSAEKQLGKVLDNLFSIAEERCDSFAHFHATVERSMALLNESAEVSRTATSREEAVKLTRERTWPPAGSDLTDAVQLIADIHSLLSHRSSGLIADYSGVRYFADRRLAGLPDEVVLTAFRAECEALRGRTSDSVLPTSVHRAWKMLKLAFSYLDYRGVPEAEEIVFGQIRAPEA